MSTEGWRAGEPIWARLSYQGLIAGPYLYYLVFAWHHLVPVKYPDSITYLWQRPFNLYYLTNRALTQRVAFGLLGNDAWWIAFAQLALFCATALLLFVLLARPGRIFYNLLLAAFLTFVFSSYTFNLLAFAVAAEPAFLCLLLLFPAVLFLAKGRFATAAVGVIGAAFILSRNWAPYTALVFLAVRVATARPVPGRRRMFVYLGLAALSLVSMGVTARFDTSIKINLVHDIYRRVLPRPRVSALFQDEYGMPRGAYTLDCRGEHVLSRCLGRAILRVDGVSGNYDLRPDAQGFVRWLEQHGRRAYISYLLLDAPAETWATFRLEYAELVEGDTLRQVVGYLGRRRRNRSAIEGSGPGRAVGFLGFDSLSLLCRGLLPVGLSRLHSLLFFIAVGIGLSRGVRRPRRLPLATSMLAGGVVSTFLVVFGDAVGTARHVFPSLVLMVLGLVLYFLSLGGIALDELRTAYTASRHAGAVRAHSLERPRTADAPRRVP